MKSDVRLLLWPLESLIQPALKSAMGCQLFPNMSQSSPAEFNSRFGSFLLGATGSILIQQFIFLNVSKFWFLMSLLDPWLQSHLSSPVSRYSQQAFPLPALFSRHPSLLALTCPGSSWPSRKEPLSSSGCSRPLPDPLQLFWSQESETHGNPFEGS